MQEIEHWQRVANVQNNIDHFALVRRVKLRIPATNNLFNIVLIQLMNGERTTKFPDRFQEVQVATLSQTGPHGQKQPEVGAELNGRIGDRFD